MKRLFACVLATLIVVTTIFSISVFADLNPGYEIADKAVSKDDVFTMDVSIVNNPGIVSLRLKVEYDATALQLQSVQNTGLLAGYTTPAPTISSPYTLRWADALAAANNESNGVIAKLTFKALTITEKTTVTITHTEARNFSGSKITFSADSADVSIACNHANKTSFAAKASTCTVQGWDAYSKCDNCDQLFDANGNAISEIPYRSLASHTPAAAVSENVVPATCEAAGSHDSVVYCSVCSGELSRTPVTDDALGHNWGDWVVTTEPTCAKKGVETRTCKNDASHKETRDVNPLGHSWGSWVQTTPPTCTEKGEETRICSNDTSHVEKRDVNALGHNYVPAVTQPTCTEKGYTTHTCSNCSDSYVDTYTDALGHDYTEKVDAKYLKSAADCTHAAVYYKSCSRCGLVNLEETFESGSPLGHDYIEKVDAKYLKSAADCTHAAVYYKSCSRCNSASTETFESGSPLGHITVEAVKPEYLKSAADCTHAAVYYKSCSRCNSALTETFESGSPLGHITVEAVKPEYLKSAADCTNPAVYYKSCSRCNSALTETFESGSPLGHTPATAVDENVVPATCEAAGSHDSVVYCSVCSGELSRTPVTDNALGHNWGDWVVTTEPTCAKKGVETRTCKNDASHKETRDVNPLGHSWGNWVQTTPPTCTEKGEETRICSNDTSHVEKRDVNALGHNYVPAVTQPTCTEKGYTTHTCSNCSDSYVDTYTDALGHDYIEKVDAKYLKSAADCTHAAVYYKSCTRCNSASTETFENGSPLGHTFTTEPVVIEEPTTEKEGKKAIVCTVCGYYDEEKVDAIPKLIAYDVEQTAGIREDSKPVYDAVNSKAVAFTAKFSKSKLQTVKVNGVALSENDYDVVEDEEFVKVTLKEDYLKKLANGNYSITLVADDGIAESTVTVKNNEAAPVVVSTDTSTSSPKTGNSDIAVIVISLMAILGVSVLSGTVIRKKRKNI